MEIFARLSEFGMPANARIGIDKCATLLAARVLHISVPNERVIADVLIELPISNEMCASSEGWHGQWEQVPPG